jgi:hypothetical protein
VEFYLFSHLGIRGLFWYDLRHFFLDIYVVVVNKSSKCDMKVVVDNDKNIPYPDICLGLGFMRCLNFFYVRQQRYIAVAASQCGQTSILSRKIEGLEFPTSPTPPPPTIINESWRLVGRSIA